MMNLLPDLLEQSAARRGDAIAIEDPGCQTQITYADLNRQSDLLRDLLADSGVRPGDRVGIYAPKCIGAVTAIFATLKARAAYVPADASAPVQRSAGVLRDCGMRAAVVARPLLDKLQATWPEARLASVADLTDDLLLVRRDDNGDAGGSAGTAASRDDISYILYTSGSTGRPKGVVHTHGSALSFIDWCSEVFAPSPEDRFSSHAPFHFDLSILDLFVPIKHGAAIVLIGEDVGKQPLGLASLIADRRISVWYSTPSILRLLVEYGKLDRLAFPNLRLVLFAGEVFPVKHLRALESLWHGPRYFNLYGPTETNVCTFYEIPAEVPEDRTDPYPIGSVCSGDEALLLDEHHREVAVGDEGELFISGGSVMQGYWNLPERTARAFHVDASGRRWYGTGDVVKPSADGFVYLGRRDRMVKRRGYRVELGEIESALYRHPNVTEAAVVAAHDEENGVLVRAFLSMANGARPSVVEMKRFCAEQLPMYMIPDAFAYRASLPKTSTDKIDYQRLLESG